MKTTKDQISDYIIPCLNVKIEVESSSFKKFMDVIRQEFIDVMSIPKNIII
jgi:hypothetical protein